MSAENTLEEIVIHENKTRKLIKILDRKNNRLRYVKEYPDGSREQAGIDYPEDASGEVWYPIDRNLCVRVQWICRQSGVDLYRRIDQNDVVYIRMPAADKSRVCWCSTSNWQGGYEALCSLRSGLLIHVVDRSGLTMFTEQLVSIAEAFEITSPKNGPFSYEAERKLAENIRSYFGLIPHDEWYDWLLSFKQLYENNDLDDNWIYYDSKLQEEPEKIQGYSYLGTACILVRERWRHTVADCEWESYTLRSEDESETVEICGYRKVSE